MKLGFFIAALLLSACNAAPATSAGIQITQASAAPTPAGVDVGAGYLTIENSSAEADQLLAASSPRAERVEIHSMEMDGAVMRMRALEALTVPGHGQVVLSPGDMHLMFVGVSQPFAVGEEIPVQLRFEHAGEINVSLPVQRPGARDGH